MIKYYCDRCKKEIDKEEFDLNPSLYGYKKINFKFVQINDVFKLCDKCMNDYISFLNGNDIKKVK